MYAMRKNTRFLLVEKMYAMRKNDHVTHEKCTRCVKILDSYWLENSKTVTPRPKRVKRSVNA